MESDSIVIVADDEPGVRSLAARIIQSAGHRVLEARDGVEALGMARAAGPGLRLVLADVRMPRLRGDQLALQLATDRPDVAVLFMSASPPAGLEAMSERDQARHWLKKPFTPGVLTRLIRKHLGSPPPGIS